MKAGTRSTAKQSRSRRTEEKIVGAALSLLSEKSYDAISISDIARRARVSIGGFYARFKSKESLLEWFHHSFLETLVDDCDRALDAKRLRNAPLRRVVRIYLAMAAAAFVRHRPILKQVALRSRTSLDLDFRRRIVETNRRVHQRFRDAVLARRSEIAHADPEFAFDLALTFTSAALREYLLFAEDRPHFRPLRAGDETRLVAELTDAFCAYLGAS